MKSATSEAGSDAHGDLGQDPIRDSFLRDQYEEGMRFSSASDLITLRAADLETPPDRYVLTLRCRGLVCMGEGDIREADRFRIGIHFHEDYGRGADPKRVVTMLDPPNVWHPNVLFTAMCMGNITSATTISELIYQAWQILTYRKWAPHDGLNPLACQWARNNQDRFPVDHRPLVRRVPSAFVITPVEPAGKSENDASA